MSDHLSSVRKLVDKLILKKRTSISNDLVRIPAEKSLSPRRISGVCVSEFGVVLRSPTSHVTNLSPFSDVTADTVPGKRSDASKRKLSATKSMPLSPISPRSLQKESDQCHDVQLKLGTLTAELIAMRRTDEELAKKFLNIYTEIQRLKMTRSCLNYCRLLDDAFLEAEMADEVPDLCDPAHKSINKLLLEKGVTSFNISSRRFSCS